MNIVFDARVIQDHFPGIGRYAYNMLAELPATLGEDEALTVLHDPNAKNTRYDLAVLHARHDKRLMWVEYHRPVFDMVNVLRAPPLLQRDAIVMHYPYYLRPRTSKPPSVTTIYDAISFIYPQYAPSARAQLSIRLLHQMAIAASQRIITISQSAARDLARFFPSAQDKIVVTPLAPDAVFKPRTPVEIMRVQVKFKLPARFALYLASNKPHKNLVRLVEAWRMVSAELQRTNENSTLDVHPSTLVIAGHQDPRYSEAQMRAQELGLSEQVRFIGEVSDVQTAALYSACDLFIFPSLYEGFGLTVLEAMACGAPVACSNTSSLPEVVGEAALLFDPTKPEEIAAPCLRVLRDDGLRAHLREGSIQRAARFTWRETARLTIAAYREVAELQS